MQPRGFQARLRRMTILTQSRATTPSPAVPSTEHAPLDGDGMTIEELGTAVAAWLVEVHAWTTRVEHVESLLRARHRAAGRRMVRTSEVRGSLRIIDCDTGIHFDTASLDHWDAAWTDESDVLDDAERECLAAGMEFPEPPLWFLDRDLDLARVPSTLSRLRLTPGASRHLADHHAAYDWPV